MNFKSDNTVPVHPAIMQAMIDCNQGYQVSYGDDDFSQKLKEKFSEIFEKEVVVYLANTGTAANSLALSALVKPYEIIFCSRDAHIFLDECGAPEMYSSGARVHLLKSLDGKIDLKALEEQAEFQLSLRPHGQKPGCVSVTQATELGTVYTVEELKAVSERCKKYQLPLHMDGARFANALVSLGITPAEMTWKVGVDVLSFGATKNGAMCAEAIVFFNQEYAKDFDYRHKRAGQLMSKGRFFASQFLAYLENDVWLKNAAHANQMAQELESVFKKHNIVCMYSTQANELFVRMNLECAEYLWEQGCKFYAWGVPGSGLYRFVTSWFTNKRDIEEFGMILGERNA